MGRASFAPGWERTTLRGRRGIEGDRQAAPDHDLVRPAALPVGGPVHMAGGDGSVPSPGRPLLLRSIF